MWGAECTCILLAAVQRENVHQIILTVFDLQARLTRRSGKQQQGLLLNRLRRSSLGKQQCISRPGVCDCGNRIRHALPIMVRKWLWLTFKRKTLSASHDDLSDTFTHLATLPVHCPRAHRETSAFHTLSFPFPSEARRRAFSGDALHLDLRRCLAKSFDSCAHVLCRDGSLSFVKNIKGKLFR